MVTKQQLTGIKIRYIEKKSLVEKLTFHVTRMKFMNYTVETSCLINTKTRNQEPTLITVCFSEDILHRYQT